MTTQPNTPQNSDPTAEKPQPPADAERVVSIRRAPSLLAFAITGALVGIALAAVLSLVSWPEGLLSGGEAVDRYTQEYSTFSVFGVLAVTLSVIGAGLATVIALLFDRHSTKHSRIVRAIPSDDTATNTNSSPASTAGTPAEDSAEENRT